MRSALQPHVFPNGKLPISHTANNNSRALLLQKSDLNLETTRPSPTTGPLEFPSLAALYVWFLKAVSECLNEG